MTNAKVIMGAAAALAGALPAGAQDALLAKLTAREELALVVTDSGMGGLSVAADVARRAQESRAYRRVDIIFANALFRPEAGYNSLETRSEKVAVFNSSLEAMKQRFRPDVLLVGCNTLSVLLPDCAAAQQGDMPVVGIVEAGVDLVAEELAKNPQARAVLLATQTTVEEGSHRAGLEAAGIDGERFVLQACPNLTWYLERDPEGFDAELLISGFLSDALEQFDGTEGPVALSFNCTHFGYATALWEQELHRLGVERTATLNPNDALAAPLFPETIQHRFEETTVTVRVVSMPPIDEVVVEALAPVLERNSPATAQALRNWEQIPDLFEWESFLKPATEQAAAPANAPETTEDD